MHCGMNVLSQILLKVKQCDLAAVKQLLRECPFVFHFQIECGWPILHHCIACGCADLDLVKLFIANGGDVNRRADSGASLLFLAATML